MRVQSLSGTKFRQAVLPYLGVAVWLYVAALCPAAAQQKADGAAPKHPPTVLATPPFGVPNLQTQCLAVNLGSTPRDVTFTLLSADGFANVQTITVEPNIVRDVEGPGGNACVFQSSDVTLIRGSGAILDSNRNALQIIPAN
jgi:hypothetical protein